MTGDAAPTAPPWSMPPTPPTGARRRRMAWIVVLVAVLGLIVISAVAGTVLFVDRTLPPLEAATDFLDDLAKGRAVRAADQLCANDRDDAVSALRLITRNFPGGEEITTNPLTVDREGDRATVEYTINARGSGTDRTYDLGMRLEGGDWRACPSDTLR